MIRSAFAIVFLSRVVFVAACLWAGYAAISDPAAVGDGIGRFFGSIVSGFNSASE